jgi:FKBP-type peptidyl-prolyl cis-trans isomerase
MSVASKTCLRMAGAAGASLVLATALPALAQSPAPQATKAAAAAPAAALNQVVTRDATTGELRAATAEEMKALQAKGPRRASAAQPIFRSHSSGAQGVQLTDESMTYSVVTRGADGKPVNQEFTSKAAAEAAVKSPATAAKPATAPTE